MVEGVVIDPATQPFAEFYWWAKTGVSMRALAAVLHR